MKVRHTLASTLILAAASLANGQIIDSGTFFAPSFRASHADAAGFVIPNVDPNPTTVNQAVPSDVTWRHTATGYVGVSVLLAEAHLRSYTETTGDRLVFGRSVDVDLLGGSLNDVLDPLLGATVVSSWASRVVVTDLDIDADKLYRVTFNVTASGGLPLGLLQDASFGISSPGVTGASNQSATTLSVLGLVTIGSPTSSNGQFEFIFKSATDRTDLTFDFAADAALQLSLLGGAEGNREILAFSGIQVVPVPEPSACFLGVASTGFLLVRRRRIA